jgi:hypothetical protein
LDLPGPVRRVWTILMDPVAFARAWPRVEAVSWNGAKPLRKGAQIDWAVRTFVRVTLRFTTHVTAIDEFRRIGLVVDGDLRGRGDCTLEPKAPGPDGPATRLLFDWAVAPEKAAMTAIGAMPGGRRLLTWGHDRVMRGAEEELVRRLTASG